MGIPRSQVEADKVAFEQRMAIPAAALRVVALLQTTRVEDGSHRTDSRRVVRWMTMVRLSPACPLVSVRNERRKPNSTAVAQATISPAVRTVRVSTAHNVKPRMKHCSRL